MLLSKKKFWMCFAVISIILIVCVGFGETIQLIARVHAENQVTYVEDVRVITSEKGKTDDAKSWCNENGYVFTGIDLNEGSDTKKNAYLCYKTTDVKSKALTEVRALVMDEGYSLYNYDQMVQQLSSQSSGTAQTMYNTSQEFIEKYNQGSPRAKDAYEGLNLFYVSDDGNQKLGDYILAGKADQTFYVKMLVQCSTFTVTMTLTLLNIGVAAYENDLDEETQTKLTSNWGEMLEKSNLASVIEDELLTTDEMSKLDQEYNDIARDLFEQIQTFVTNYENAVTNYKAHGYTIDNDTTSSRKSKPKNTDDEEETDAETDAVTEQVTTEGAAETENGNADSTAVENGTETVTETEAQTEAETEKQTEAETEADNSATESAYNTVTSSIKEQFEQAKQDYYNYDEEDALAQAEAEIEAEKSGASSDTEEEYDPSSDAYYIACFQTLNEYEYDEGTKLGDWIVETGHLTSEEVDYRDIYPLVEAMGTVQADIVCLTGVTAATYNLQENESSEDFRSMLDELKELIKDYNGNDNDSMDIYAGAEGNYKDAQLAFTNENIRKTQASNSIGVTSEKDKFQSDIKLVWKCFGLVMTIIGAVAAYLKIAAFVVNMAWASTWVSSTVISFFTAAAAGVGSLMAGMTVVLLVIIVIVVIVFLILYYTKDSNRDDDHTDYPNYVFDAVDRSDKSVATIKYQSVRGESDDPNDDPTDINCKKQYQWVILEQTSDPYVGSRIVVTKDSKGNDITFKTVKDSNAFQTGYDCVKYFGNTNPCDLNGYCDDPDSKLYLHYTTEESTGQATPADKEEESTAADDETELEEDEEQNYIGDMIISIGKNATEARAGITSHSGKFYYLDYNFSPDQDFYTYIGYSITTDPDAAFTDLRVAPYRGNGSDSSSITYGDISYTRIGTLGYYTDPGEKGSSTGSDALYYTKDSKAGSPILVQDLQGVTDPSKLYNNGLQPVTFFGCDIAYNFNTAYEQFSSSFLSDSIDDGSLSNYVSWYGSEDDHGLNDVKSAYLCYSPETKYTEGTKYLSGIFFYGGHDWEDSWYVVGDVESDIGEFTTKLTKDSHVGVRDDVNLARPFSGVEDSGKENIQCYIGYTWSYNPKRAITHAYIYQGDSYSQFSTTLNYSVSKTHPDTGNSIGYVAATYLYQGEELTGGTVVRYPDPNNCFRSLNAMLISGSSMGKQITTGYTETLPKGVDFGWTKHAYLPTALYVGGHQDGVDGLTLDDMVLTVNKYDGTNVDLSGETAVSGSAACGSFYPVVDMKNPHETEAFNLGYPDYYHSAKESKRYDGTLKGSNQPYYLYLKGAREEKKTYISSISIGAYSREQYEDSNGEADDDTLKEVDKVVNKTAMAAAASGCADEMLVYNIGVDTKGQSSAWYNRAVDDKDDPFYTLADRDAPEDVRCAYIGVTRTSNEKDAIRGVLLYQTDATTAGNTMTYNSVKYYCAGNTYPIYMNGTKYYLYYTKNSGVSPGKPIEDIKIDNTPIISGYATNLCGDSSHSEPYGNPDQTYFIHLKYTPDRGDFFNKLYVATGATSRKAQCELLTNGCNEFIDLDLNGGLQGDTMLLGFRRGTIDWDKVNGMSSDKTKQVEYESQTQEAIYDIIVTNGEECHTDGFINKGMFYCPVTTQNLNSSSGDELYLYVATPWFSAKYNKNNNANTTLPQDEYSGYLTGIAFAQSDRVPYNTSQNTEGSSSVTPWEYIMEADNVTHANFNSGEVKFTDNYAEDCRITMFGQRSDGSVKPSGEITGGFLEAQYAVGELKKK